MGLVWRPLKSRVLRLWWNIETRCFFWSVQSKSTLVRSLCRIQSRNRRFRMASSPPWGPWDSLISHKTCYELITVNCSAVSCVWGNMFLMIASVGGKLVLALNWIQNLLPFRFSTTKTTSHSRVSWGASGCAFAWTSELISAFFRGGGRPGLSIYSTIHKLHLRGRLVWELAFQSCFEESSKLLRGDDALCRLSLRRGGRSEWKASPWQVQSSVKISGCVSAL